MHDIFKHGASVLLFLLFLLVYGGNLGALVAASSAELRSLLEFKKGISADPLGKVHDSWNPASVTDPDSSPQSWHGVTCNEAGNVTAIELDRLSLEGDLKFFTLRGLTMLTKLSLSNNLFTGRLVPAVGLMSSLQHLDLSNNGFYGPIPSRINRLSNMHYLNLSSNIFEGGLPSGFHELQQLKFLDLHSNRLQGDIEGILSELRNVELVDLSHNSFYGSLAAGTDIISSFANALRHVNMSHNSLSGEFFRRDSVALFRNLEVLDLGDNQIVGELPSFTSLTNLRIVHLGNNLLHGSIPEELLQGLMPLVELDLSNNSFTGFMPEINSTTLNLLDLSSNQLSGSLPSSSGGCKFLDLSRNLLSGDTSIMQRWTSNLEVLDLSSNKLTGKFPNLSSQFQNLVDLKIKNNSLVGTLPLAVGAYPKITAVDLSLNKLDGRIPRSFFTSSTLKHLNLSGNHFTGAIPFIGSQMSGLLVLSSYPSMDSLDLSGNHLTGTLCSDIGKMEGLTLLDLARNSLSGKIPIEMNKLTVLKKLDLSSNNFSDRIPDKLSSALVEFNVSNNNLSGPVPENLIKFSITSFRPGNALLILPNFVPSANGPIYGVDINGKHHGSSTSIRVAIIVASVGVVLMILFALLAYHRAKFHEFHGGRGFCGQTTQKDIKPGIFGRPSLFMFHTNPEPPPLHFSNDRLLASNSRSLSGTANFAPEIVEHVVVEGAGAGANSDSQLSFSPQHLGTVEQSMILDEYSTDRLAGQLFFLDASLDVTPEQLSQAPAEVLGRSSHGTLYKASLNGGRVLAVKWLQVGLVRNRKDFAKEVKKISLMRHSNIVPLRAYYWGPRELERLILTDFVNGDSLATHLYVTTPRRYSSLSFSQRLKVTMDVARALLHLHSHGLPHGNLKPTNVLLSGPTLDAFLTDYGLHRLMTLASFSKQIPNLSALGYCAPELSAMAKPAPSFKSDVYAFGVILMEVLTGRSAGDIISGQTGAVDLTDWVRSCAVEGRGMECVDGGMARGEEGGSRAMEELLGISIRCVLPVNERPNMRWVFGAVCSVAGGV